MRLALLMLAVAALAAGPAGAQQSRPASPPQGESAVSKLLRGPVGTLGGAAPDRSGALRTAAGTAAAPASLPALRPLSTPPPPTGGAGQCRMSCAREYYFCLSGEAAQECPTAWGQCRNACDAPSPLQPGPQLPGA